MGYLMSTRAQILTEIQRLAAQGGGQPPGSRAFTVGSGVRESEWRGVYWARWGDALLEAGFAPNEWQGRLDAAVFLKYLADECRHFGVTPTKSELDIYRRNHPGSPSYRAVADQFGTKGERLDRLREWVAARPEYTDVAAILGPRSSAALPLADRPRRAAQVDGFVYLIRSGVHHKIGRSEQLERRVREIRVALPEALTLEHAIRTDDAPGIEAYWHRRFADRRANGEWFKLTATDVASFKRRKFQ